MIVPPVNWIRLKLDENKKGTSILNSLLPFLEGHAQQDEGGVSGFSGCRRLSNVFLHLSSQALVVTPG
jgi:hypothetical protein